MSVIYKKSLDSIKAYTQDSSFEAIRRQFNLTKIIKLGRNENNHGFSPRVSEALLNMQSDITRYPDANCTALREALARRLGITGDALLFGNGSFELLSLVAQAILEPGSETILPRPSFDWYWTTAWAENAVPVEVSLKNHAIDLDGMAEKITPRTRGIWLCNPNNPTGTYFTAKQLNVFLEKVPPEILVILDEAYIDFATADLPKATELIQRHQNIIALRTFSKVYGLASLRIGYAIANPELIEKISRIRQPPNTNAIAQAAALAALGDEAHYRYVIWENEKGKRLYYEALERLGLEYIPTQSNFIMFSTCREGSEIEYEYMKRGILIRSGKEFGMPAWVRVTIGTEEENKKVLAILEEIMIGRNNEITGGFS